MDSKLLVKIQDNNSLFYALSNVVLHVGFACMEASRAKVKESHRSYLEVFLHICKRFH